MSRSELVLLGVAVVILLSVGLVLALSFRGPSEPACPNVEPGVTPSPVLESACETPSVFHQAEEIPNAYLRPAPAGQDAPDWLELALPSGRWLIHSDCSLTPWTEVTYHSSAPNLAGVNDCALDAWIALSPTACATDALGVCSLEADQSYQDYLARS